MKFRIGRASSNFKDELPVDGAKKESVDTEIYFFAKKYGVSTGEAYTIEINSMEDLVSFVKKEGEILLSFEEKCSIGPEILIHDDFVE